MNQVLKTNFLLYMILLTCMHSYTQKKINGKKNSQSEEVKMIITQTSEKNKKTIRRLYEEILNTGKLELLNGIIHEEYTGPGPGKGPASFIETVKGILQGFPDIQWKIEDLIAEDDKVTVRWTWKGTHKGSFREIPATAKQVTDNAIVIYQFKEDKIIHAWIQSDRLGVLQQIGVLSQNVVPSAGSGSQNNGQANNSKKQEKINRAAFPYQKKRQLVLGHGMAYVETGSGDPIVFLHGNPTSSYIWRNIIPYVQHSGRCIAPDLIGMGDSEKLPDSGPDSYTFVEQRKYLDKLLELLDVKERIIFVVHDWGSALAFDWTYRHPDAVKGIAYMEAIVRPRTWSELPEAAQKIFQAFRSPEGEQMVLQQNSFIEFNLPNTILRKLSEEEMDNYRRPFTDPGETRRPMLTWARQLPIDGKPADVTAIVEAYGEWLTHSSIPKLFIEGKPGTLSPAARKFCHDLPSQVVISVPGIHNIQEDSPDEVGIALSTWIQTLK